MNKEILTNGLLHHRAELYARELCKQTNHLYDNQPYDIGHLEKVIEEVKISLAYLGITNEHVVDIIIASTWLHDSIEDHRVTYNNLRDMFGKLVAEIAYYLTNLRGKTRGERASDEYYRGINNCLSEYSGTINDLADAATLIKLCDRVANIKAGLNGNKSSMLKTHRVEHWKFVGSLLNTKERAQRFSFLALLMTKMLFHELQEKE